MMNHQRSSHLGSSRCRQTEHCRLSQGQVICQHSCSSEHARAQLQMINFIIAAPHITDVDSARAIKAGITSARMNLVSYCHFVFNKNKKQNTKKKKKKKKARTTIAPLRVLHIKHVSHDSLNLESGTLVIFGGAGGACCCCCCCWPVHNH